MKKWMVTVLICLAAAGVFLFALCVWPFGLMYSLAYDCLLNDPALNDDLGYLAERGDCRFSVVTTVCTPNPIDARIPVGERITVGAGYTGTGSPEELLSDLSREGGLTSPVRSPEWLTQVEEADFRMMNVTVYPRFFLNEDRIKGAQSVRCGFYCRIFPWFRIPLP